MQRLPLQLSVTALLIVVAGVALNLWLFRFGALAGILGLSVTKHVAIAWLCQALGIDKARAARHAGEVAAARPPDHRPAPVPEPEPAR